MSDEQHRGWYNPRLLPHADFPGTVQFITYRLGDSLPQRALLDIEHELKQIDPKRIDAERRKRMEDWLDAGHGCCILKNPQAAACVVDSWKRFDGERYDLIAWVVMPNHVHILIHVYEGVALSKIVQSWKNFTSKRIKQIIPPGGVERLLDTEAKRNCRAGARHPQSNAVWEKDYWDRFIRNDPHLSAAIEYIHQNPVKACVANHPEDWPWSSAAR